MTVYSLVKSIVLRKLMLVHYFQCTAKTRQGGKLELLLIFLFIYNSCFNIVYIKNPFDLRFSF